MIALYIITGLLLALAIIALLPSSLTVKYREELEVEAKVMGKSIRLYPKPPKKTKATAPKRKKVKKPVKNETKSPPKKRSVLETLGLIKELLATLIPKTAKRIKIKATRIFITVGSSDAAKTALLFPAVNGAVLALVTYLDNEKKFDGLDRSNIAVRADFLSGKITADIEISFSLRLWHIAEILLATAFKYTILKSMNERT